MARSLSTTRPRKRQPKHVDEQRPVLQLPLERPDWRDPVERGQAEPERERGVARSSGEPRAHSSQGLPVLAIRCARRGQP